MTKKLNGYYTRKLRRSIAKAEGQAFEPVYNGKEPITYTEHLANFKTDYKSGKTLAPRSMRLSPLNTEKKTALLTANVSEERRQQARKKLAELKAEAVSE